MQLKTNIFKDCILPVEWFRNMDHAHKDDPQTDSTLESKLLGIS